MIFFLRFVHYFSFMCFGGFFIHDFWIFIFSSSSIPSVTIRIFYFITVPAFLILLISGVLLIVYNHYYFKREKWLQRKFIVVLGIMLLLIVAVFPEMKNMATAKRVFSFPLKIVLLNGMIILLFLWNLGIALRHRTKFPPTKS
ncbi:hypothetical protein B1H10_06490 [candidate division KSB1 bacterium 4484_188]|nr:MAG: hypothetical protein B1H10_06490 [candidate division KSB1 bacterium 4484_188]